MEEMISDIYIRISAIYYGQMIINGIVLFLLGFIFVRFLKERN